MSTKKSVEKEQQSIIPEQAPPVQPRQQLTPEQAILAVNAKTDQIILQINKKLGELDLLLKTIQANQELADKDRDLLRREIKFNSIMIDKFLNIKD